MSIGTIALFVNWLLEGKLLSKLKTLSKHPVALAVLSVFALHLIGLLWTTDMDYALHDLQIKLPLLIIPLVLSTRNFEHGNEFKQVFTAFVAATVVSCTISAGLFVYRKAVGNPFQDVRDISIFISHIRLSLMAAFAIFGSIYFIYKKEYKIGYVLALSIFLILFLILLQSITGLVLVVIFSILFPFVFYKISSKSIKLSATVLLVALGVLYGFSKPFYDWYFSPKQDVIAIKTQQGNTYRHNTTSHQLENGYYVNRNICDVELTEEWNKRSTIPIDSMGQNEQIIKPTLIRYLTSLGLKKDAEGVQSLSQKDIENIKEGKTHNKEHTSVLNRVDEFFYEMSTLIDGQNPSNNSFSQRIFAWGLAVKIIKKNPIYGVGTGDVSAAFHNSYQQTGQHMVKKIRAHNQYLTFIVAFGIFGFIPIAALVYFSLKRVDHYTTFKRIFMLIVLYSFLFEDTLETQAGVTFLAFFMGMFLLPKLNTQIKH